MGASKSVSFLRMGSLTLQDFASHELFALRAPHSAARIWKLHANGGPSGARGDVIRSPGRFSKSRAADGSFLNKN
jgi:hypothetical protein